MQQVNITELRNHLPHYMKQVQKGVEFLITSHGEKIARLVPEVSAVKEAHNRLMKLRGTMIKGDILEPVAAEWNADANNL
ncbi:MAG: type II toxin-antitoxin system prevent-host-death family antitoxin [Desulfobacterales bacterium]|nr:type II toxin-antitoxin system prevent-host-death family antitoxin [Desulfobacterales bacterium]